MTSEVCLMNRQAAVLAADSATTVVRWNGREQETLHFKGANKIHELSDYHPVGIMMFSNVEVLHVPWEVIVKAFRRQLKDKAFDTLDGYAEEFFRFLEAEKAVFPADIQNETTFRVAKVAAVRMSLEVKEKAGTDNLATWTTVFDDEIKRRRSVVDAQPLGKQLSADWASQTVETLAPELATQADAYLDLPDREPRPSDFRPLAELLLWSLLKDPNQYLDDTGLVVAGYGDADIFPGHVRYLSNGLVAGKHLASEVSRQTISHTLPADLTAFAHHTMIDTFQLGLDESVYIDALQGVAETLDAFAPQLIVDCGGDAAKVSDLAARKQAARQSFASKWMDKARAGNVYPLQRVLAAMPIDEMADLAETLVTLQSLKERMTKPAEEVGGPVDVAAITKNEGLVWIKRKHRFDPAINPGYVARLGVDVRSLPPA